MNIKARKLGSSNIAVNPIGLGTMPLAIYNRPTEPEAIKVIHAAFDAGIDFIDTADVYCLDHRDIGYCERLIAKALKEWKKSHPNQTIIVATKGGLERLNGDWTVNAHPAHLIKACDASLKSLEIDCIDLYQLHAPDRSVSFADSVGALAQLQRDGKIRHIGLSNVSLKEIKEAQNIANIVSIQNRCNAFDIRSFQDGVIPYCEEQGLAFLPYSPMGGSGGKGSTAHDPVLLMIANKYKGNSAPNNAADVIASTKSITPFQILLAWFLEKSPVIIPIPGASKVGNAVSSAQAMHLKLDGDDIEAIDKTFLLSR